MVDLPSVPRRLVTTEAAKSSVTAADIAGPYKSLGAALDSLGEGLEGVSVVAAEQAAHQAVTRDANGELQVEQLPPMLGKAGRVFNRMAAQSFTAQMRPKIQEQATQQSIKNEGRPQEFAAWGEKYVAELVSKQPTPELQDAVRQMATQHVGEVYNGMMLRQGRRDLEVARDSIASQQASIENDLNALTRGGLGPNSDEYTSRIAQWDDLQRQRVENPAFGYGPVQAQYERQQFLGRIGGAAFLHRIDTIAKDKSVDESGKPRGGIDVALKAADSILTDPKLTLTDQQRHAYWARASSELRALKAERTQARQDAREAAAALDYQSISGMPVEPSQVERVAQSLRDAGDPAAAARLYSSYARKPLNDSFATQPLPDMTRQLGAMKSAEFAGSPRARQAYQFFLDKGWSPAAAAGAVGNMLHESGLDPKITHDGGTGLGIAGWRGERLQNLKRFAAARGTQPTDFQTQLAFVDQELRTSETTAGAGLAAAKTAQDAAAAFLHFERPRDYSATDVARSHGYANRVGLARAVAAVNTGVVDDPTLARSPMAASWLLANRSNELHKSSDNAWSVAMKDWDAKGIRPADATINQTMDAARLSGNARLLDRMADDLDRIDTVQAQGQRPVPEQQAATTALGTAAQAGTLAPGQSRAYGDLERKLNFIRNGLKDDPVSTVVSTWPERFKPFAPIDPTNPDSFRAGLAARARVVDFGAKSWQVEVPAALDSADLGAVRAAIDAADPQTKARIFGDITAALPEPIRLATFAKLGEKGPAAMVDAYAGALFGQDRNAATAVIMGQRAMLADKRFDPLAEDKKGFHDAFDRALPPTTFGIGAVTSDMGAWATVRNAARAHYAFLSAQAGDTSNDLNEERLRQSITAVTGGVLTHNGGKLIAPVRGMTQSQFDGVLWSVTDQDLAGVTTLSGTPVTAAYLRSRATLESVGDGQYQVRLGNDLGKPIYAHRSGAPYVLDLRGRDEAQPVMIQPPAYMPGG